MPTFATPNPIDVTIDLVAGDTRIVASDRDNTVVDVRPRGESNELDVRAAAQVRVACIDGKLIIKAPKPLPAYFTSGAGTFDVTVELPAGSRVRGHTGLGDFQCEGPLGECTLKTAAGDIGLDEAAAVKLSTIHGAVTVDRVVGDANVTGAGDVRIGDVQGTASIKNINGDSWIGHVTGDVSLHSAHGNIYVDRAGAGVTARTAFGNVIVGEVVHGAVVLRSASGGLEIGIRKGTAAWLDVKSRLGRVRNDLEPTEGPEQGGDTLEVRAHTYRGDIVIRHSTAA